MNQPGGDWYSAGPINICYLSTPDLVAEELKDIVLHFLVAEED